MLAQSGWMIYTALGQRFTCSTVIFLVGGVITVVTERMLVLGAKKVRK